MRIFRKLLLPEALEGTRPCVRARDGLSFWGFSGWAAARRLCCTPRTPAMPAVGACRTIDLGSALHLCSCSRALTFRSIYDSNGHRSWELKTRSTSSHVEP